LINANIFLEPEKEVLKQRFWPLEIRKDPKTLDKCEFTIGLVLIASITLMPLQQITKQREICFNRKNILPIGPDCPKASYFGTKPS
jgi:hypothetical protein